MAPGSGVESQPLAYSTRPPGPIDAVQDHPSVSRPSTCGLAVTCQLHQPSTTRTVAVRRSSPARPNSSRAMRSASALLGRLAGRCGLAGQRHAVGTRQPLQGGTRRHGTWAPPIAGLRTSPLGSGWAWIGSAPGGAGEPTPGDLATDEPVPEPDGAEPPPWAPEAPAPAEEEPASGEAGTTQPTTAPGPSTGVSPDTLATWVQGTSTRPP